MTGTKGCLGKITGICSVWFHYDCNIKFKFKAKKNTQTTLIWDFDTQMPFIEDNESAELSIILPNPDRFHLIIFFNGISSDPY